MKTSEQLHNRLNQIDGRGYKAYKEIQGSWLFPHFTLHIDYVQGDPFASPSRLRAVIPPSVAGFDPKYFANQSRAIGLTALLARRFEAEAYHYSDQRGTGKSGLIQITAPQQAVMAQTAITIGNDGTVEARFTVGLPARGRSVLGFQAIQLLLEDVPDILRESIRAKAYRPETLWRHVTANEDADMLRASLAERRLVAFVADGAILPRQSGIDDQPLASDALVPFASPSALRLSIPLPHAGEVTGMGIPAGVTLIVGGGYHGKSTLLRAIERGIYNHRPDDGRELVVSDSGLVKIRAEDGRAVSGVNISPFINNLPLAQSTEAFQTTNASGSTSQAAAIMEAVEVGATGLLIDEDTAATNFMIRDGRMQRLVPKDDEPITPFIDRVRQLYEEHNISSILVIGGSGDYLDVADTVIAMNAFCPQDVTVQAKAIAAQQPTQRQNEAIAPFAIHTQRIPQPRSVDASRGKKSIDIKTRHRHQIQFGHEEIDLAAIDQLVVWSQTRAISEALWYARQHYMDGERSIVAVLQCTLADIEREGLDVLDNRQMGDFAHFRIYELAAALNRLRSLHTN